MSSSEVLLILTFKSLAFWPPYGKSILSVAHIIIIIKVSLSLSPSEVPTLHIVVLSFHGCGPKMFVASHSVTYCIYIPRKPAFFIIIAQFMMSVNSRIRFSLQIVFVCLYIAPSHYHHCANLFEDIELHKTRVTYILSSVWVRLSIFAQLSNIQYVGLFIFSLPISLVMIERIYILYLIIIIKSEVWIIIHYLGLDHETMVCAVCLSMF